MNTNWANGRDTLLAAIIFGICITLPGCGDPTVTPTVTVPAVTDVIVAPTNTAGVYTAEATSGGKLSVLATTLQIRSLAEAVAGDRATVRSILTPGADAHEFEPKPEDVQVIGASALVLKNGIGLDNWIDKLITNAGGARPLVTVTEGIPLREGSEHEEETSAETEGEEHAGEGMDPHVWLDATNAMTMTRNIRDALIKVDPAGSSVYSANADAYLAKLGELDRYIEAQVATIPEGQRKMVTNHDAFGYFINRYSLQYIGSIIPSMSTEAEPSARDVADLIEKIKAEKVRAIFLESSINPQLANQIAGDTGVKLVDNLYADSMGAPGSPGDTYEGMMRHNVDTIVSALK